MSERGKAKWALVSAGSNTTVKSGAGTVYKVVVVPTSATPGVRIEGSADLGATPNLNSVGADTILTQIGLSGATTYDFGPGVGFDGLSVAATSNARITVVYE